MANLERVVALEPEHATALGLLGYCAALSQDQARAAHFLERAVASDPAHPQFRMRLASAYLALENVPAAQIHLEAARAFEETRVLAEACLAAGGLL